MTGPELTMKAWRCSPGYEGGILSLAEVSRPSPGPGQVVVKVHAAGVNRGEIFGLQGMKGEPDEALTRGSGNEFAGEVAAIGSGVTGWGIHDKVMGRGAECHAEFVAVNARALMRVPPSLSMVEAACIPNVFVTAHDAVVTAAAIQPGEVAVVTAGSSGVGTAAIQIAKFLGARVIATTRSSEKRGALEALGADAVVDSRATDWIAQIRDFSGPGSPGAAVVIDQVGGALFPGLLQAMATGGRYVSVGRNGGRSAPLDLDLLALKRLALIGVTFRTRDPEETLRVGERFAAHLLDACHAGQLHPVFDHVFPFHRLPAAHEYMLANRQFGKVVIEV